MFFTGIAGVHAREFYEAPGGFDRGARASSFDRPSPSLRGPDGPAG